MEKQIAKKARTFASDHAKMLEAIHHHLSTDPQDGEQTVRATSPGAVSRLIAEHGSIRATKRKLLSKPKLSKAEHQEQRLQSEEKIVSWLYAGAAKDQLAGVEDGAFIAAIVINAGEIQNVRLL